MDTPTLIVTPTSAQLCVEGNTSAYSLIWHQLIVKTWSIKGHASLVVFTEQVAAERNRNLTFAFT